MGLELVQIITSARGEAKQLDEALRKARFRTHHSSDGPTGMVEAKEILPALIVLDVDLSGMSGEEVCQHLREDPHLSAIPLVFIGTDTDESERARMLDLGADDYLTKPVGGHEVVARVKAVLRRGRPALADPNQMIDLDLMLEGVWCGVSYCGHRMQLTTSEWSVLQRLVKRSGKPVPQEELIGGLWGEDGLVHDRELDRMVKALNQKLAESGCPTDTISWTPNVGYLLKRPAA
ncbi:MAG: response regulator transcription factor [Nitrospirae bacterium]|nr:response regulator transcription factor [Nitrospirota bacterium]